MQTELARPAAISKAGTAAFFSTQGSAFSTRTASFIVQEHFPPQVNPSPGGPLFGVQFSNVPCSDVNRGYGLQSAEMSNLPLGLSADPGGLPLYKNGVAVGGIGVEGDGVYGLGQGPLDTTPAPEELIAAAGAAGFPAPTAIRGDNLSVGAVQFVFANAETERLAPAPSPSCTKAMAAPGTRPTGGLASPFLPRELAGTKGSVPPAFDKGFNAGATPAQGGLTSSEVADIIGRAANQADRTRAAIRLPIGTPARVTIAVVDAGGMVLGIFRTLDAPIFGFDVSVQKARTAAFFSSSSAGLALSQAGFTDYVNAARNDGLALDGSVAFSTRAVGFLSQPIFPPGAGQPSFPPGPGLPFQNGPFSKPLGTWSIFNTGLQLDILLTPAPKILSTSCTANQPPIIFNGITIFPGGFPLYKGDVLVGGIGVSGDGVDQDDLIGFVGSMKFQPPAKIRSDNIVVRSVTLPYGRFPRNPNL
jgi:uncharacterized protein GlcG (DUF336 family)